MLSLDVPGKLDHASIVAYEVGHHGASVTSSDSSENSVETSTEHTDSGGRIITASLFKECEFRIIHHKPVLVLV